MKDFAKIVRTEGLGQIVIMREGDNDNGEHVTATFQIDGGTCSMKIQFKGDPCEGERADDAYAKAEDWAPKEAAKIADGFSEMIVHEGDD